MISSARLRLLLATRGRLLATALAVAAVVLLLLAAWTAAVPATETTTEDVETQTVETTVAHSAEVTAEDAPWASGTVLEDHPVYLTDASPVLQLQLQTIAPPDTAVDHELRIDTRVERDGDVVWEESTTVVRHESEVDDGGRVVSEGTADVSQLRDRRDELRDQFAGAGDVSLRLVATTRYETDDGAEPESITVTPDLETTDRFYWISGTLRDDATHTETREIEHDAPLDWGQLLLSLLGAGLAGAGAVAVRRHDEPDDLAALRQQVQHERFDEWISRGQLPAHDRRERVTVDSLPDLVDVAIDTDGRVIYDASRDRYAVLTSDVAYYYSRDAVLDGAADDEPRRRSSAGTLEDDASESDRSGSELADAE